jgi:hypothetical protein
MKLFSRSMFGLTLAALLSCGAVRPAAAQFSITITVDENGNGKFTNSSDFMSGLASALVPDPGPGGHPSALTYDLLNPPGLVPGVVFLMEPGMQRVDSDLIRFNPTSFIGGAGSLVFYSDIETGDTGDLADDHFPDAEYTDAISRVEVGPEDGMNGLVYTPTAGMPGFVAGAAGPVTYDIISDTGNTTVVPEPGSLALLASGGLPLLGLLRRRRAIL